MKWTGALCPRLAMIVLCGAAACADEKVLGPATTGLRDAGPGAFEEAGREARRDGDGDSSTTATRDGDSATGAQRDGGSSSDAQLDAGSSSDAQLDRDASMADGGLGLADGAVSPWEEAARPTQDAGRASAAAMGAVDVLFVIDNSGSMATEQLNLAVEFPRLVEVLASGDLYKGREAAVPVGLPAAQRYFPPVASLHLGVVSTNMGGIDAPEPRYGAAVGSCQGLGDDGKLQNSVELAVSGVTVDVRGEFGPDYLVGDVAVPPKPGCAFSDLPRYQEFVAGGDATTLRAVADKFGCTASLGVRGCPYEQQLEATWKALAPSNPPLASEPLYEFLNGSRGQGDAYNAGFLRTDAVLAIVEVSDEEDCSITDAGKVAFAQTPEAQAQFGPINLRCGTLADRAELVRPTARYIDGLRSLKPGHSDRIIFGAIVGVPLAAVTAGKSIDQILALPEMQAAENPQKLGFPLPSCTGMTGSKIDEAYPPRRILEVAKGFGEQAVGSPGTELEFAL